MNRILFSCLILLCLGSCSYLPSDENIEPQDYVIKETTDYIALVPTDSTLDDAMLLIPGGLVDPHAYISLLTRFTEELNMLTVIPKMRGNLAILNPNAIYKVTEKFPGYRWILAGHSLGGTLATRCINDRSYGWEALCLLGSYSTEDISSYNKPVFSTRGESDGLTTATDWTSNAENLPTGIYADEISEIPEYDTRGSTVYYVILGGNHAQFGSYGEQNGDGAATISSEEQKLQFFNAFVKTLRSNEFKI